MFCWEKENWNNFNIMFPLWFEFCTLVGCFRIIVMHALNGKHIPYALNDDDDELDDNDRDDVFNEDDDGNDDDDDDDHRHICHCHHDYHNSHHHRHNHHPCHHHRHCP